LLLQDVIPHVGGISIQLQRFPDGMRTVGYDVPAVDWMHYDSPTAAAAAVAVDQPGQPVGESAASKAGSGGCSCGHAGAHRHTNQQQQPSAAAAAAAQADAAARLGLSADRLQSLQQQLQEIAQQRRVTGYNVPAFEQQQELFKQFGARQQPQQPGRAVAVAAAAATAVMATVGVVRADSESSVQRDDLMHARRYFKNPCNNPDARQQFKNTNNHPLHRSYYKNPANAPVHLQDAPVQSQQVRFLSEP
jgi:hypothetical protein